MPRPREEKRNSFVILLHGGPETAKAPNPI